MWFAYAMIAITLIVFLTRGKSSLRRQMMAEGLVQPPEQAPVSMKKRAAMTAGFLTAAFWALIFVAWKTGDRSVAAGIVGGLVILGAVPLWLGRNRPSTASDEKAGGWYVSLCGLIFLAVLNWRLDVWLAPIYGVGADAMARLLPMAIIHWLSAVVVAWTAALVFITQPDDKA